MQKIYKETHLIPRVKLKRRVAKIRFQWIKLFSQTKMDLHLDQHRCLLLRCKLLLNHSKLLYQFRRQHRLLTRFHRLRLLLKHLSQKWTLQIYSLSVSITLLTKKLRIWTQVFSELKVFFQLQRISYKKYQLKLTGLKSVDLSSKKLI